MGRLEEVRWNDNRYWRVSKYLSVLISTVFLIIIIIFLGSLFSSIVLYIVIISVILSSIVEYWVLNSIDKTKTNHYTTLLRIIRIEEFLRNLENELIRNRFEINKIMDRKEGISKYKYYYEIKEYNIHIKIKELFQQKVKGKEMVLIEISIGRYSESNQFQVTQLRRIVEGIAEKLKI